MCTWIYISIFQCQIFYIVISSHPRPLSFSSSTPPLPTQYTLYMCITSSCIIPSLCCIHDPKRDWPWSLWYWFWWIAFGQGSFQWWRYELYYNIFNCYISININPYISTLIISLLDNRSSCCMWVSLIILLFISFMLLIYIVELIWVTG